MRARPRRELRRALLGAAAGLMMAAAPAAASEAGSVTRTEGNVTATLAWDAAELGIANARLAVVRDGVTHAVAVTDICLEGCIVAPDDATSTPATSALKVADLDADGEREVLVDVFSGGAHCCVTTRVLTFDGAAYAPSDIAWGDVSYRLADLDGDGRPELSGYDPRFSAAFTAYAASWFPVQVLQVTAGRPGDVTRRFPTVVRRHAKTVLADLRKLGRTDDVRGALAAYVAEQYLLGRNAVGLKEITRQRSRRAIPAGFRTVLLRQLRRWGYR